MRVLALASLALLLVPAAAAAPQPGLYFLRDGEHGPVPALPGRMNGTFPDGVEPSLRAVTADPADVPLTWFVTDLDNHTGQLLGPLFLGLWLGHSSVKAGNLTVVVHSVAPDGTRTRIANATVDVAVDPTQLPDPASLVPPDPTDPQAAAAHAAAKALEHLLQPPMLFNMGRLETPVPADHQIAVVLLLEPAPGETLVHGAAVTVQYDSQLSPSFLYAPWYAPDPPRPSPKAPPRPASTAPASTPPGAPSPGDSEDTPLPGLLVPAAFAVALGASRRRR